MSSLLPILCVLRWARMCCTRSPGAPSSSTPSPHTPTFSPPGLWPPSLAFSSLSPVPEAPEASRLSPGKLGFSPLPLSFPSSWEPLSPPLNPHVSPSRCSAPPPGPFRWLCSPLLCPPGSPWMPHTPQPPLCFIFSISVPSSVCQVPLSPRDCALPPQPHLPALQVPAFVSSRPV